MKRSSLTIILMLTYGVAGCRPVESTSQPCQGGRSASAADGQDGVVGMGRVEPAGGIIDVGAMMGDRLGRLLVKEGDVVKKGVPLAELESRGLRELELEAAALNVKKAEAAELGTAAHQQKIDLLKVSLALAQKDQERIKGLSKDLASDQERERQALVVRQAATELESAQASLRQLLRANELNLSAAKLEQKRAQATFDRTQVAAPCDGTILKTYVRPGETIGNKPILQMADLGQMIVAAEVYENEIQHLRLGQRALVTSRAFPPPSNQKGLEGKVTRIGRMINIPVLRSVDPFAPADRHVVEVRVELDKEGSRQAAALSNLQVDVRFLKRD
jgi:HlyD family secretion protein